MIIPSRGRIYRADLGYGPKPFVVVSNNLRNRQLESSLAVRLTTSVKPDLQSIIELGPADPMVGRVLCDDIIQLYRDEITDDLGAVSRQTMQAVGRGLAYALSLQAG